MMPEGGELTQRRRETETQRKREGGGAPKGKEKKEGRKKGRPGPPNGGGCPPSRTLEDGTGGRESPSAAPARGPGVNQMPWASMALATLTKPAMFAPMT